MLVQVAVEAEESLARLRDQDRKRLEERVQRAGGPRQWLERACPRINAGLHPQSRLKPADLTAETLAFWEDAEARLAVCGNCTSDSPGRCAEQTLCFKRGLKPTWQKKQLTLTSCDEWAEHLMLQSLIRSGVDERAAGLAIDDLEGFEEEKTQLKAWLGSAINGGDDWLVIRGGEPEQRTHLAVGTLRGLKSELERLGQKEPPLWYADFALLAARLKDFFRYPDEPDPTFEFRNHRIAVLDHLQPGQQPSWLCDSVSSALYQRWRRRLPTLICTAAAEDELGKAYPMVRPALAGASVIDLGGEASNG